MEIVDLNKLETALTYVDRITNGNNPVNNMPVGDDNVLNNPNLIRCMFFIKDILQEVKRNDGVIGSKPKKKGKADFPYDVLKDFQYQEDTTISKFVDQINQLIDVEVYKKVTTKPITQWLLLNKYLMQITENGTDRMTKRPTEKGNQLGIRVEDRVYGAREYQAVVYDRRAQEFLAHNLESILNGEVN